MSLGCRSIVGLTSTGTGSDKAAISGEIDERLVGRLQLSSEVLLMVEALGLERFIGVSSSDRGILDGPGAFNNARVEEDNFIAEGGSFVEEGSTIGARGAPNTWMGGGRT